ncbi:MAG: hypothetical protein ACR5LA_11990 [Wolbachia sp.]
MERLDPSVKHWDDTICCKLTFTLWSCRYPERIQSKFYCDTPVAD